MVKHAAGVVSVSAGVANGTETTGMVSRAAEVASVTARVACKMTGVASVTTGLACRTSMEMDLEPLSMGKNPERRRVL